MPHNLKGETMKVLLTNENPCCFELTPVNKRLARAQEKATGEESILFQTDWDFPALARNLGWSGKVERERCQHRGTDGTVDCPDCGLTASQFIQAASDWLYARCGQVFRKPVEDYFNA